MSKCNKKKAKQLNMSLGKASHILRKQIMFFLLKELEKNYCFQCGAEIKTTGDMSIEHKVPWLDSEDPVGLFFDLNNIGFSHIGCNVRAARRKRIFEEEDKVNMRKARMRRVRKVKNVDTGEVYSTIEEAADVIGMSACNLGKYINGKMKSMKVNFEFI